MHLEAAFIQDVTIPDNTRIGAGQTLVKTWRVRTVGTCTYRFSVLENDGDPEDGLLTAVDFGRVSHAGGNVSCMANGLRMHIPVPGYSG